MTKNGLGAFGNNFKRRGPLNHNHGLSTCPDIPGDAVSKGARFSNKKQQFEFIMFFNLFLLLLHKCRNVWIGLSQVFQNNVQRLSGGDLTRPSPKPGELLSEFDARIGFAQHWLYLTSDHIPHGLGNFAQIFFRDFLIKKI